MAWSRCRYRKMFTKFTAVRRGVSRGPTTYQRDVPVSATKYIKPSYNNLGLGVRLITTTTRKMTYILISFEALRGIRADATCYRSMTYGEIEFACALRR